jgi:hypothetical protein
VVAVLVEIGVHPLTNTNKIRIMNSLFIDMTVKISFDNFIEKQKSLPFGQEVVVGLVTGFTLLRACETATTASTWLPTMCGIQLRDSAGLTGFVVSSRPGARHRVVYSFVKPHE